jgi:hypothetical protein
VLGWCIALRFGGVAIHLLRAMTTPLINQLGIVKKNIVRADREIVDHLKKFDSATVHEAMGRVGLMKPYMRPIYRARWCPARR